MQPEPRAEHASGPPSRLPPPPPALDPGAGSLPDGQADATIAVAAPALLIEARFRDLTLASRLLRADRPGRFAVGPGRRADSPVNPAWLGTVLDGAPPHPLVEQAGGAFRVNLAAPMRAQLWIAQQRLPVPGHQTGTLEGLAGPPATTSRGVAGLRQRQAGPPDTPLSLPSGAHLRIPCGEVTFELRAVEPVAPLPRPLLPSGWRTDLRYPAAVALGLTALLALARLVPSDPRALSLDPWGADRRFDRMVMIPLDVSTPAVDRLLQARAAGAGRGPAAAGPSGQAGSRRAPRHDGRLAIAGTAKPTDARQAAARIRSRGLLGMLTGQTGSALADVLANGPALGADTRDVLGQLQGAAIAEVYASGGLGTIGTGAGNAGAGESTLGTGGLGTVGRFGQAADGGRRYGTAVGPLGRRTTRVPNFIRGDASVRGALDKEIIRRTVRRHLNEVRFCYEQALVARPTLAGRVVVQFTIAPTGRVLAALLQSTTLGAPAVDACVVGAVRRWEFPQPDGGGLVSVTYPFQLSPAGR